MAADRQLAHMVFFTLKDKSDERKAALVASCDEFLTRHDGTVYFSAGVRVEELQRDVNDHEFDVGLHVVFENKAAHDKYQEHERHLEFIEKNRENWAQVRVFDSYLTSKK